MTGPVRKIRFNIGKCPRPICNKDIVVVLEPTQSRAYVLKHVCVDPKHPDHKWRPAPDERS